MDANKMTKEDFEKVPYRKDWNSQVEPFNSLVIIPTDELHDSGYRIMNFIALNEKDEPIARISQCADVLEIDGLGGYGKRFFPNTIVKVRPIEGWKMDCLPTSGYLRLYCKQINGIECGNDVSSFEIFYKGDN